ncbi:prolipoprotein diacylglyceryl transferase, partial [Francisella tularensis subsp. holarctica]|nr:prolipoprotein diacylglyceryl transferase [Francisella tularensis subsp. holarctica]
CEFFRQPDPQYGYIFFNWMTMGQRLSIPMILLGAVILIAVFIKTRKNK